MFLIRHLTQNGDDFVTSVISSFAQWRFSAGSWFVLVDMQYNGIGNHKSFSLYCYPSINPQEY